MPKYTLKQKLDALQELQTGQSYESVSTKNSMPMSKLREWYREREAIRREYQQELRDAVADKMLLVQQTMADKAALLVESIDADRIKNAPLNQVASALGVLIDRYLKLQSGEHESSTGEQVFRIEYYDASTGKVSAAPPWARNHPESSSAVQSGGVRTTLRQDDDGANYRNGKSDPWDADMVAGSDVPDGESGLAGFEDGDDGRNWYHD
jgi:hypothetical protein